MSELSVVVCMVNVKLGTGWVQGLLKVSGMVELSVMGFETMEGYFVVYLVNLAVVFPH